MDLSQPWKQPLCVRLEALVLRNVDERVDAVVAEDRDNGEMIECTAKVHRVAEGEHQKVDLKR